MPGFFLGPQPMMRENTPALEVCLTGQGGIAETAAVLELVVAAVKTRLHRARLFLREALAEYFVERRHTSA